MRYHYHPSTMAVRLWFRARFADLFGPRARPTARHHFPGW